MKRNFIIIRLANAQCTLNWCLCPFVKQAIITKVIYIRVFRINCFYSREGKTVTEVGRKLYQNSFLFAYFAFPLFGKIVHEINRRLPFSFSRLRAFHLIFSLTFSLISFSDLRSFNNKTFIHTMCNRFGLGLQIQPCPLSSCVCLCHSTFCALYDVIFSLAQYTV